MSILAFPELHLTTLTHIRWICLVINSILPLKLQNPIDYLLHYSISLCIKLSKMLYFHLYDQKAWTLGELTTSEGLVGLGGAYNCVEGCSRCAVLQII